MLHAIVIGQEKLFIQGPIINFLPRLTDKVGSWPTWYNICTIQPHLSSCLQLENPADHQVVSHKLI